MPAALEGIVYVEMEGAVAVRPPVEGHWESDDLTIGETGEWSTIDEAVAWGRRRAPTVVVRRDEWVHAHRYFNSGGLMIRLHSPVELSHRFYSAGEHHHVGDDSERWPGASDERDTDTVSGYDGAVHLIAGGEMWTGSGGFSVRWEAVRDGEMVLIEQAGPAWHHKIDRAIAWGRARAAIVLVCLGPPNYNYHSAGEVDPPGLEIPPFSPRGGRRGSPTGATIQAGGVWIAVLPHRTFPLDEPLG